MNSLLKIYYNAALDLRLPIQYFPAIDCLEVRLGHSSYFFIQQEVPLNWLSSIRYLPFRDTILYFLNEAGIHNAESFYREKNEVPQKDAMTLKEYSVLLLKKQIIGVIEHDTINEESVIKTHKTICPSNAALCKQIAHALHLDWLSLRLHCTDIRLPFTTWYLTEIDNSPDIRLYENPNIGEGIAVGRAVLKSLIYKHYWFYLYHRLIHQFHPMHWKHHE